jgi:DNA-binding response OmpR family regulator
MAPAHILVIDDEAGIRRTMRDLLTEEGYTVTTASSGEAGVALIKDNSYDLLLIDLRLPGIDGMEVVKQAKEYLPDAALIILTGHGSIETAIEGLHQGIFDYLLKTSDPLTVLDRVKAALADRQKRLRQKQLLDHVSSALEELRGAPSAPAEDTSSARRLVFGNLQLDTWRQQATRDGQTLPLTPTEFRVLLCLAEHAGQVMSYATLVRCAQGYETSELEAGELIKPHIHHLRQKLEADPSNPRTILNVRGTGYVFSVPNNV